MGRSVILFPVHCDSHDPSPFGEFFPLTSIFSLNVLYQAWILLGSPETAACQACVVVVVVLGSWQRISSFIQFDANLSEDGNLNLWRWEGNEQTLGRAASILSTPWFVHLLIFTDEDLSRSHQFPSFFFLRATEYCKIPCPSQETEPSFWFRALHLPSMLLNNSCPF